VRLLLAIAVGGGLGSVARWLVTVEPVQVVLYRPRTGTRESES
jgi:fluoride ion exporter CrcB/FEX